MKLTEEKIKELENRLNRVRGQVRGVSKMLDQRECGDILTQILAARSALNQVGFLILKEHTEECIREIKSGQDIEKRIEKLLKIYFKLN